MIVDAYKIRENIYHDTIETYLGLSSPISLEVLDCLIWLLFGVSYNQANSDWTFSFVGNRDIVFHSFRWIGHMDI